MALPLPKPKALLADKGYDGDRFRENLLMRGILPIIPPRSNRKVPVHPDYRRYKDRNRVERMFGKLKQQRRIATRYDKTVLSFESFLNLAASRLWLKSFVNTARSFCRSSRYRHKVRWHRLAYSLCREVWRDALRARLACPPPNARCSCPHCAPK
jgi:transposase